jgi:hypothetical protein
MTQAYLSAAIEAASHLASATAMLVLLVLAIGVFIARSERAEARAYGADTP